MNRSNGRYRLLSVLGIMILMLTSLGAGAVAAQDAPGDRAVRSATSRVATCTTLDNQIITCELSDSTSQVNLETDLLPLAQQLNSSVDEDTTMWLQAWGTRGRNGANSLFSNGGSGGHGGVAQAVTSIAEFKQNYNPGGELFYFLGRRAGSGAGRGGASTIVALTAQPRTVDDVVLIAGGGSGGTDIYAFLVDGKNGARGGSAISDGLDGTIGKGQNRGNPQESGNNVGDGAFGGSQNGPGVGGGNFPNCIEAECVGIALDGIGGVTCGQAPANGWSNGNPGVGTQGQGGVRTNLASCGGGGYGGGQGGNSFNTSQGVQIWAGAGGGSYARGTTTYDGLALQEYQGNNSNNGIFRVVFNTSPAQFQFADPVSNPFNLNSVSGNGAPAFVDINADGTQDLFVGTVSGPTIYFENVGTKEAPQFASGVSNAFGLQSLFGGGRPTFGDIDDDGDFDAFIGSGRGITVYFENTGTPTSPRFAQGVGNPFGLRTFDRVPFPFIGNPNVAPALIDINADNLLDMFIGTAEGQIYFFENVGTPSAPQFADRGPRALGIIPINDTYARPAFADVNGDGVLDMFIGGGNSGSTGYYKNFGTASDPQFLPSSQTNPPTLDPFGITSVGSWAAPAFADLTDNGFPDLLIGAGSGNLWYYEYIRQTSWPEPDTPTAVTVEAGSVTENQVVMMVYGNMGLDASLVTRDTVELGDGTATMLRTFRSTALGDVNGDGYLDRSYTFYTEDTSRLPLDSLDGEFICLRGVTLDGDRYEGCAALGIQTTG